MAFDKIHQEFVETNLRQIQLCTEVLEELTPQIIDPISADGRADLLLATEELAIEISKLYKKVYKIVWQENLTIERQSD
jgi:hypothetical protein